MALASFRNAETDRQRVCFLKEQGFTSAAIAWALAIPESTVKRWVSAKNPRDFCGRPTLLSVDQDKTLLEAVLSAANHHNPWTISELQVKVTVPHAAFVVALKGLMLGTFPLIIKFRHKECLALKRPLPVAGPGAG